VAFGLGGTICPDTECNELRSLDPLTCSCVDVKPVTGEGDEDDKAKFLSNSSGFG